MVNATFIFDSLDALLESGAALRDKLARVSELFYDWLGIRTQFCGIFGKRWSWFSGIDDDAVIPMARVELCEGWGIIADSVPELKSDWQKLLEKIGGFLKNRRDLD